MHNHCLHRLFEGITIQNAVTRLVQAHTASDEEPMWANQVRSTTMSYVTRNLEEIRNNAMATLELLGHEHPDLLKQVVFIKCGLLELMML